ISYRPARMAPGARIDDWAAGDAAAADPPPTGTLPAAGGEPLDPALEGSLMAGPLPIRVGSSCRRLCGSMVAGPKRVRRVDEVYNDGSSKVLENSRQTRLAEA